MDRIAHLDVQSLVTLAREGDREAMALLIGRHEMPLRALISRMLKGRSLEDMDDVYQDTVLNLVRAISIFRGHSTFYTFAYRVCMNMCLGWIRAQGKHKVQQLTEDLVPAVLGPDETTPEFSHESIRDAILSLPKSQRNALILVALHERSYEQTQITLGLPSIESVKGLVHRARLKMRSMLGYTLIQDRMPKRAPEYMLP